MTTSADFGRAYDGVVELVGRISAGEVRDEVLGEEIDAWRREDCRGASTLAEAATLALKYELANTGSGALAEGNEDLVERMRARLRAVSRVESSLRPPGSGPSDSGLDAEIYPVALPEEMRSARPDAQGFVMGPLQIIFEPHQGPPHAHISVSHASRYPTWEEIQRAVTAPGGPAPNLWAWLPNPEQDSGSYTVNLYLLPPEELLGRGQE